MISAMGWVARHALVLLVAVSLAGCLPEDDKDEEQQPTEQPTNEPPPAPPPTNAAPEITGTPEPGAEAGQALLVHSEARRTPTTISSSSRSRTSRRGLRSSAETGALAGTPTDADVGDTADITISVTDGRDTRSVGPFKIKIKPRDQPPAREFAADDFRRAGQRGDDQPGLQLPAERERSEQRRHAALCNFRPPVVGELQHLDRPPERHADARRTSARISNIVISVNDGQVERGAAGVLDPGARRSEPAADDQRLAARQRDDRHGLLVHAERVGSGPQPADVLDCEQAGLGELQHLDRPPERHARDEQRR